MDPETNLLLEVAHLGSERLPGDKLGPKLVELAPEELDDHRVLEDSAQDPDNFVRVLGLGREVLVHLKRAGRRRRIGRLQKIAHSERVRDVFAIL